MPLALNPIRMPQCPLPCTSVESKCELTVPTQAAGPLSFRPFLQPWGQSCALQRADSISTQADWTSILLIFLTLKEAEMEGHPPSPDGQASSSLLLPAHPLNPHPPPQSPFLLLAVCRPFLLGHKGSVDRHYVLFANTGPGYMQGGEGETLLSPFTQTFAFSFQSPPPPPPLSVFEHAYKNKKAVAN